MTFRVIYNPSRLEYTITDLTDSSHLHMVTERVFKIVDNYGTYIRSQTYSDALVRGAKLIYDFRAEAIGNPSNFWRDELGRVQL